MEKLSIDLGIKSYQFVEGGAPLVFNPSDPNVYARYMHAMDEIKAVETEMAAKANAIEINKNFAELSNEVGTQAGLDPYEKAQAEAGAKSLQVMEETDRRIKNILNKIFGGENDFDKILMGVNLMAVTESGDRVVNSLLEALAPIMEGGAKTCVTAEIKEAKLNREQRRALGV